MEIEAGTHAAVLEPYAFSELLWYFGFTSLNALACLEGGATPGRIGEQLFHESFTLVDDGLTPRGLPKAFDFEGVPKQRVTIVDKGVAKDVVWDRRTAKRAGEGRTSTGHALAAPVSGIRARCPSTSRCGVGDATRDELVERVGRGNLCHSAALPWGRRPPRGDHHRHDARRHLPDRGRPRHEATREPSVHDIIPQARRALVGLSKDVELVNRSDFYEERYPFGTLVPAVATSAFTIVGTGSGTWSRRPANGPDLVGTRKGLFSSSRGTSAGSGRRGPAAQRVGGLPRGVDPRDGALYAATNSGSTGRRCIVRTTAGDVDARREARPPRGERPQAREDLARRAGPRRRERPAVARRCARRALPLRRRRRMGAVEALLNHETRDRWNPGAGGLCCHSIELEPRESQAYVRRDLGRRRVPQRRRRRDLEPRTRASPPTSSRSPPRRSASACTSCSSIRQRPERLWQQNHFGVYRSDDRGDSGIVSTRTACRAASASRSCSTRATPTPRS